MEASEEIAWAPIEFAHARLWDARCRTSLVQACQKLVTRAGLSLSRALGSQRKSLSRIVHHATTTPDDLLAGHVYASAKRAEQHELILVASDTTDMDFSGHPATLGLGGISNRKWQQGFLVHSALALTPQGVPLGVLYQNTWSRATELSKDSFPSGKESDKWLAALHGVEAALAPGCKALLIQDREADYFAFLSAPRREGIDLLVRATKARPLESAEVAVVSPSPSTLAPVAPRTLLGAVAAAPVVGHKTVQVQISRKERISGKAKAAEKVSTVLPADREAFLTLRFTQVRIVPPLPPRAKVKRTADTLHPSPASLTMSVIQALEENPPAGVKEPVHWVLLTSLSPPAEESALATFVLQMLDFYAHRWRIERFHFVLKSGCRFERLQVGTLAALQNALSLYSVVAWRLLSLMYLAREVPDTLPEVAFSEDELEVLSLVTGSPLRTLPQALRAVAKLGGFVGSPSAGEPGVQSLWIGYRQLEAMVAGFRLARGQPPPTPRPPN